MIFALALLLQHDPADELKSFKLLEGFEANGQMNADYHGLGDHADKLDFTKMQDITRFAYRHLLGAANL